MKTLITILFLATILAATTTTSHGDWLPPSLIQLNVPEASAYDDGLGITYHDCLSWRLAVETGNIKWFSTIPGNCIEYVKEYLLLETKLTTQVSEEVIYTQYRSDSKTVCKEAYFYAKGLALKNDTVNVWIFDLDDTTLSNVPFYAAHGFGSQNVDKSELDKWVSEGRLPVLPETLHLYKNLQEVGIKPVLISERTEDLKDITLANLYSAGYTFWEKVIFRPIGSGKNIANFKSGERKKLVRNGYTIIGNIGDQWSDLVKDSAGRRTFKLPNPIYIKN